MDPNSALTFTDKVRDQMVCTKITCPFLGSAVHQNFLTVRGDSNNPLASTEDVRRLGNSGGSKIDGEPAVSLEDVRGMFLDMTLPIGWET